MTRTKNGLGPSCSDYYFWAVANYLQKGQFLAVSGAQKQEYEVLTEGAHKIKRCVFKKK